MLPISVQLFGLVLFLHECRECVGHFESRFGPTVEQKGRLGSRCHETWQVLASFIQPGAGVSNETKGKKAWALLMCPSCWRWC